LTSVGIGAASAACAGQPEIPVAANSSQFEVGQVWRYKTRPEEEGSRAIIGKIDKTPTLGTIVHVKLTGLRLRNSAAPDGTSTVMSHAPVSEAVVSASVTELTAEDADLEGFQEGYMTWLLAFRAGEAGVFTLELAEIANHMEQILNQ
jgi:hypothetical protein